MAEENQKDQLIKNLLTQWKLKKKIERYTQLSNLKEYAKEELRNHPAVINFLNKNLMVKNLLIQWEHKKGKS